MHTIQTRLFSGALFLASVFLSACGGGGGGGAAPATTTYTVGGTITGLTGTVVLQNNGGNNLNVSANGSFTFSTAIASGPFSVTVLTNPNGQTCTASSNTGTVSGANITTVSVVCSTNSYTIGGNITGLTGTGLVLRNNGGNDLTVSASATTFTFSTPIASGSGYTVTVFTQPANQRCTVTGDTGNANTNVTTVVVSCVNIYAVNAAVTGVNNGVNPASIGLVLQNTGSVTGTDKLDIAADGTFAFSKGLAETENYNVKVLIQPAAPAKTCTVAGTFPATMPGNAVNVGITCAPPVPRFAYVANSNSGDVSAYTIDTVSGALTSVGATSVPAGSNPNSVTVAPSGKFAYVANIDTSTLGGGDISAYTINSTTGALTPVSCGGGAACNNVSPATGTNFLAGSNPIAVSVDPSGQFAYVANLNSNNISAYTIDAGNGMLASVGAPVATGSRPSSVTLDHTGKFAYVANADDGSISAYTINPTSGALIQVLCGGGITCEILNDVSGNNFLAGAGPQSLDIDPTSRFAYAANATEGTISAYAINPSTGALTPIDADAVATGIQNFAAGTTPTSIAVHPSGKYVYVANKDSGNVSAYSIDNATGGTGAPSPIGTFNAGANPTSVAVDLSGKFVYVANNGDATVTLFQVSSSDGSLATPSTSFQAGTNPSSVITTVIY